MTEKKEGLSSAVEMVGVGEPPKDESEQLELIPAALPLDGFDAKIQGVSVTAVAEKRTAGRPKGAKNKRTQEWADYILSQYQSPLIALAETYSRPTEELSKFLGCKKLEALNVQLSAAKEVASYVHQKMPVAVDVKSDALPVFHFHMGNNSDSEVNEQSLNDVLAQAKIIDLEPLTETAENCDFGGFENEEFDNKSLTDFDE